MSHVSMVPTKHRFACMAVWTAGMLVFNHSIFIAEKYGDIGKPMYGNEKKKMALVSA